MNTFDFSGVCRHYFNEADYDRIRRCFIGIAGCGGLGSNCALFLVRSGFERFLMDDFDVVEASNLNRQAYSWYDIGKYKAPCLKEHLLSVNPAASIKTTCIRITADNALRLFDACDVVVEAFDTAESKAMLAEALLPSGKLVVSVSGIAGYGDSDRIRTKKIRDNYFVIGDGVSGVGEKLKPHAPCVSIAAAKQADVILSWVLGGTNKG